MPYWSSPRSKRRVRPCLRTSSPKPKSPTQSATSSTRQRRRLRLRLAAAAFSSEAANSLSLRGTGSQAASWYSSLQTSRLRSVGMSLRATRRRRSCVRAQRNCVWSLCKASTSSQGGRQPPPGPQPARAGEFGEQSAAQSSHRRCELSRLLPQAKTTLDSSQRKSTADEYSNTSDLERQPQAFLNVRPAPTALTGRLGTSSHLEDQSIVSPSVPFATDSSRFT